MQEASPERVARATLLTMRVKVSPRNQPSSWEAAGGVHRRQPLQVRRRRWRPLSADCAGKRCRVLRSSTWGKSVRLCRLGSVNG